MRVAASFGGIVYCKYALHTGGPSAPILNTETNSGKLCCGSWSRLEIIFERPTLNFLIYIHQSQFLNKTLNTLSFMIYAEVKIGI